MASGLFGHGPKCYQYDNKCHCSSKAPYLLPPEEGYGREEWGGEDCNREDWRGEECNREEWRGHSKSDTYTKDNQFGRHPPVLGHEPQCYYLDNKCHCPSSQPYLLPPEASQLTSEPSYSIQLSAEQIIASYSSLPPERRRYLGPSAAPSLYPSGDVQPSAPDVSERESCHHNDVFVPPTRPCHDPTRDDQPPPYESLFPSYKPPVP